MARNARNLGRDGHDHKNMIVMTLSEGPMTLHEIQEHFYAFLRPFGFFTNFRHHNPVECDQLAQQLLRDLDDLLASGSVERLDERYTLTAAGQQQANKQLIGVQRFGNWLQGLKQPQTVSQVAVGAHLALAALKLPAGLISGSIGLINDAADTLLDGLSSLLVYAGLRFDKERVVSVLLVILMLGTGGLTFYEAFQRFFLPIEPDIDWFTFLAVLLSALVCLGLGAYQRYVGLKSNSFALIAQSIDARNHVIVAAGVTTGLIASLLHIRILDTLVGLVIALLILKSAIELAVELARSFGEEEPDLSRYKPGFYQRLEQFRRTQLSTWMLYLIQSGKAQKRIELHAQAQEAFNFSQYPVLRELGVGLDLSVYETIEQSVTELFARGWVTEDQQLKISEAGAEYLKRETEKANRFMVARRNNTALVEKQLVIPRNKHIRFWNRNVTGRLKMQETDQLHFKMISFVHETLYGWFRNPYKVLEAAGLQPGQRVLEVGCGPGFFTLPAASIVGENGSLVALDVSPLAVRRVQEKVAQAGIINTTPIMADAAHTGLPDQSFDLVFVFGFARPIGSLEDIWMELYRILKPGGILSIEGRPIPPNKLFNLFRSQARISQYTKIT